MKDTDLNSRLVYSTSHGSICPACAKPAGDCACRKIKMGALPKSEGPARIRYETKGRKGKAMTLITGLALSQEQLLEFVKELKQRFGTGGTVKNYAIELQGDHREQAAQELRKRGYEVK